MITMLDVSIRAGVSKATVSRVLNGTGQVKKSTREAVFKAMDELGYRPNFLAQSLANKSSNSIGLVVSNFDGPYFGRLLRQAAKQIEASGKHLVVTDGHDTPEDELQAVQLLADRRCDAIILYTRFTDEAALMALFERLPVPLMVINRDLPQARERCVFFEQQQAAFDAVNYLIAQGHRDIACITGPIDTPTAQARLAGYRQALAHHQIAFDPARVAHGDSSVPSGYHGCKTLLAANAAFSALFASNDDMAIGAMKALCQAGKRLPQDVSIFGFDDEPSAAYLQPALSTVYLPIDMMIEAAIAQALRLLNGEEVQPLTPFTGELKLRESVAPGPYAA
ncbi:TPA: LacI family DNA-binding transcriptional regulator [Serratia rubidaea]|uniref:LacI family DNA-binding transcriptional regulator n=1 Tax=Serratia rubidaea TaxID=61652 RepID=UPI0023B0E53E|nr:LacI family DNA-binding transcriptional regulator [Serratia rubidaea]MDK1706085.1 LacI family DNA-binding transcriptional regulator [Serratia rubidaea]HDJ1441169.1 LacI family DNA-binding transcriptional regulator [Serratia rubidaea]HDJ1450198.1 LacI family DNA-binding transcriptional regulator [Serratia rubidaea]HDJ1461947.1 LacI family DNA-binding transcriptional regulator [Serratia rubidaea]HDJ2774219.1 LacI family DNA-binding transcriptional regulator [Serratia rubidaea]